MARLSDKDRSEFKSGIVESIAASTARLHINQSELAEKCGIPISTMSYRLNNPGTFRIDEILAIANVCNVSPLRLCGGE